MRKLTMLLSLVLICALLLGAAGLPASAEAVLADELGYLVSGADGSLLLSEGGELYLDTSGRSFDTPDDNYRVFYEIFTGSFSDSDGDGVGDLRGIINRMDYLNDGDPASGLSLGVEGLWLTPIFESPTYHKYDVTDYYRVDDQFGTLEDLRELIELCHARGVQLIIDLPINHSGDQNEWFEKFRLAHITGNDENAYYDFYSFVQSADGKGVPAGYKQIGSTKDYYECNFSEHMPEFNFDSEAVRQEMLNIARFYLDMGVDGFRFDAAKYIYFGDHQKSLDFWKWYMGKLREIKPEIYAVAEVWDGTGVVDIYTEAFNCFDFTGSQLEGMIARTAKGGNVNAFTAYVEESAAKARRANPDGMTVPFITNHDMDRAAGFLPVSNGDMAMAANLYLLTCGSPFIYYGEEIGMKGSRGGANTDANRRLHMLWGDGDTVADPEGATYTKQVETSVKEQLADENSLLTRYRTLIAVRRCNPEIARGEYKALSFANTKLGGFVSSWNGDSVCVLHNTAAEPVTVDLRAAGAGDFSVVSACVGEGGVALDGDLLTLDGRTSAVLRMK